MPGWTTGDNWHNNIAYTPGAWIALHRICEKHGVGDQFRIHYDPSHAILMGQDTRSIFQYLKDDGYGFLIGGFHVKGQVIDSKGVSAWGYGGQTMERGDWIDGKPSNKPADQAQRVEEAGGAGRARAAGHRATRSAGVPAEPHASTGSIISSPRASCCRSTLRTRIWSSSTNIRRARIQDRSALKPILQGSIAFVRHIDEAAACMYALQHEVLAAQGIPVQGIGRQAYRS